jgi:hypothetical protein
MKVKNRVSPHLNGKPKPPSPPNGYGGGHTPLPQELAAPPEGRDPKSGRFGRGNTAAAGHVNPTARARAELQKALVAAVSKADIEALARRLLADAVRGQVASAELLLRYVIGKPAKAEDPDRVALEGWRLVQAWPMLAEFIATATSNVNPDLAADYASSLVPDSAKKLIKKIKREEDQCDFWGHSYMGKQTDAVLGRRLTKGH